MTAEQLDMFSSPEYQYLNTNVEKYKTSADNVRKGVFARLDAMKKELHPRIELLESQMAILMARMDSAFPKEECDIIELKEACL